MRFFKYFILLCALFPSLTFAHEVYVLPRDVIARDLTMPSLHVFDIITAHAGQFFFWMFLSIWAFFTVLAISISKPLEKKVHPLLARIKQHAPLVARLTLGVAITSSGYFGAMFGPELPFADFLPPDIATAAGVLLVVLGTLITAGLFTRLAAAVLILIYGAMCGYYGIYMLTYTNYLGEMLIALILGNSSFALDRYFHHLYPRTMHHIVTWLEEHAFLILRVSFGISLIFASVYAKLIYAQLALDTVTRYNLTNYFPFDPPFIVLGAFCIELLLGLFFLFGIEIRFASLFLLFWLSLSLLYFGEAVWPHIILAGVAIAICMRGYDAYTLQLGFMRRNSKRSIEPTF